MVALTGGRVTLYVASQTDSEVLTEVSSLEFAFEVSCLALTSNGKYACVNLCDIPLYSLYMLDLSNSMSTKTIVKIEQRSLMSILEYEAYQDILTNTLLAQTAKPEVAEDQEMIHDDFEEEQ
jgi:hypothetical protein